MRINKFLFLLVVAAFCAQLQAVDTMLPDGTIPNNHSVATAAFDRYSGTFYFAANNDGAGDWSLGRSLRTYSPTSGVDKDGTTANNTGFDQLTTNAATIGAYTNPLALIHNTANTAATHIAFQNSHDTGDYEPTDLKCVSADGSGNVLRVDVQTIPSATNGEEPNNFNNLTSAGGNVFLHSYKTHPGSEHAAVVGYKLNYTGNQLEAVTNDAGLGVPMNLTGAAAINTGQFSRFGGNDGKMSGPNLGDPPIINDMYWDPELETLFIGATLRANAQYQRLMAITKVKFNENKIVASDVLFAGTDNDATTAANPQADNMSAIFAYYMNNNEGFADIKKIRTMKTSTGKYYLIVNGGAGNVENTNNNNVWALRYNPEGKPVNDADAHLQGLICSNNNTGTALVNGFVIHTNNTQDKSLDMGGAAADNSNVVGAGPCPWETANGPCSDMHVVGDTVYVSFSGAQRDANNDPGVWASTAMFNNYGTVIGWTSWERMLPTQGAGHLDRTNHFAVDGQTGAVWGVMQTGDNQANKIIRSGWQTTNFADNSLPDQINTALPEGCFCCLDLPKGTPGVAGGGAQGHPHNSLVAFGGYEKVVFARTKKGDANEVVTDFSAAEDFNAGRNDGLRGAGAIRCLQFSRSAAAQGGYFFAGTDSGLYAYVNNTDGAKAGWNTQAGGGFTGMNAAPFADNHGWVQMGAELISGAVTHIESSGAHVYVVEIAPGAGGTIVSKLHRFTIGDNVEAMEQAANHAVIAQSGTNGIPANAVFTGFRFITGDVARNAHQGIISTNAGIYKSEAALAVLNPAGNNWEQVKYANQNGDYATMGLFGTKRIPTGQDGENEDGIAHTVYAYTLHDGPGTMGYFQHGRVAQVGAAADATAAGINYQNLNGETAFQYGDERISNFWTDGGRRFATSFNANETNANGLYSLPYYSEEWGNMTIPYAPPELSEINRIYWIENISGLGIVLAGTDNGVVGLQ